MRLKEIKNIRIETYTRYSSGFFRFYGCWKDREGKVYEVSGSGSCGPEIPQTLSVLEGKKRREIKERYISIIADLDQVGRDMEGRYVFKRIISVRIIPPCEYGPGPLKMKKTECLLSGRYLIMTISRNQSLVPI